MDSGTQSCTYELPTYALMHEYIKLKILNVHGFKNLQYYFHYYILCRIIILKKYTLLHTYFILFVILKIVKKFQLGDQFDYMDSTLVQYCDFQIMYFLEPKLFKSSCTQEQKLGLVYYRVKKSGSWKPQDFLANLLGYFGRTIHFQALQKIIITNHLTYHSLS